MDEENNNHFKDHDTINNNTLNLVDDTNDTNELDNEIYYTQSQESEKRVEESEGENSEDGDIEIKNNNQRMDIGDDNDHDNDNEEDEDDDDDDDDDEGFYEPIDYTKNGLYKVKSIDENTEIYRWRVNNFWQTSQHKIKSPSFKVSNYPLNFFIFPYGNSQGSNHMSLFLEISDYNEMKEKGEKRYIRFMASILSHKNIKKSHTQDAEKIFKEDADWGFSKFISIKRAQKSEFTNNGDVFFEVAVHVVTNPYFLNPDSYNSKKETGYVGLKNQGATCYLNSLLQTWFHIKFLRKSVYKMPIDDKEKPTESIPLALQRVFYNLQSENEPVCTKELTKSFGWKTLDSFLQHDVQELLRVLSENLEKKMEKTPSKGIMKKLFCGKIRNYIKCINVHYESKRDEEFYDLQLNVKGCKDIYESFSKYIEEEILSGDNQYRAGDNLGLQDAKKGTIFIQLPPILTLHLKRFDYNFVRDVNYKINSKFIFHQTIDVGKYLADDSPQKNEDMSYQLISVLVHSGDVSGGHYYSFIKTSTNTEQWYKFDDEKVYKVKTSEAIEQNFGGKNKKDLTWLTSAGGVFQKIANAYMLVYIKKSEINKILEPVKEKDVPHHLRIRVQKEKIEKAKKEREERESIKMCSIRIVTDKLMKKHQGYDLYSNNMEDFLTINCFKNSTPNQSLKLLMFQETGIIPERQRYFKWERRKNKTTRPGDYISPNKTFSEQFKLSKNTPFEDIKVYMEESKKPPTIEDQKKYNLYLEKMKIFVKKKKELDLKREKEIENNILNYANNFNDDFNKKNNIKEKEGEEIDLKKNGNEKIEEEILKTPSIIVGSEDKYFQKIDDDVFLLFVKKYCVEKSICEYIAPILVSKSTLFSDIEQNLNQMCNFEEGVLTQIFEEVSNNFFEKKTPSKTMKQEELGFGDIIIVQRALNENEMNNYEFPNVKQFYNYLTYRTNIEFININNYDEKFKMELLLTDKYGYIRKKLGEKLNYPGDQIRITGVHPFKEFLSPQPFPFRSDDNYSLKKMIYVHQQKSDQLFYEKLEMNIQQIENMDEFNCSFFNEKVQKIKDIKIILPKNSTSQLLMCKLVEKVGISNDTPVRLCHILNYKIIKFYQGNEVLNFDPRYQREIIFRGEIVPKDETNLDHGSKMIQMQHFDRYSSKLYTFGDPFYMISKKNDTLKDLKKKIQEKINVPEKDFKKYKFAPLFGLQKNAYLKDDDIINEVIDKIREEQSNSDYNMMEITIGMEHTDQEMKEKMKPWYDRSIKIQG